MFGIPDGLVGDRSVEMSGIRSIFGSLKYTVFKVKISRWEGLEVEEFFEVWSNIMAIRRYVSWSTCFLRWGLADERTLK